MKVTELIIALQKAEEMKPGLDVGIYDAEFMTANPIRHVKVEEELYYDYDRETKEIKQLMVVLSS